MHSFSREGNLSPPEFTLLELEEVEPYEADRRGKAIPFSVGMDDQAETNPCIDVVEDESPSASFSASPVLMSCLRDIAQRPRHAAK